MTSARPERHSSSPAPADRSESKALLLKRIEQQRIDILVETQRWQKASRSLDGMYQQAQRYRGLCYLAGGALVVAYARHPGSLIRLSRHLASAGLLFYRVRRLLRTRR
ncbi:YqjK family protein [Halomonas sp. E19]|uniref:YqjK family protein n=1 Tax=Halomonas sp. E19 TaxID=3397247 RepID=UPI004033C1D8